MVNENARIAKEMVVRGRQMRQDAQQLNPDLDASTQTKIEEDIERRAGRGCQTMTDPTSERQSPGKMEQLIVASLIPNLAVQCEVARADPPTIEQVEATTKLSSATGVTALRVAAIAENHNLSFALTPTPSSGGDGTCVEQIR
jgi:hypothetical protein